MIVAMRQSDEQDVGECRHYRQHQRSAPEQCSSFYPNSIQPRAEAYRPLAEGIQVSQSDDLRSIDGGLASKPADSSLTSGLNFGQINIIPISWKGSTCEPVR